MAEIVRGYFCDGITAAAIGRLARVPLDKILSTEDFWESLSLFADIEDEFEPFESTVNDLDMHGEIDRQIQHEIDIRLGK